MKFIFIYRLGEKDKMFLKEKDFVFLLFTIISSVSCASGTEDEDREVRCPSFCSICKQIIDSFKDTFCIQQRVTPVVSIPVDQVQQRITPIVSIPITQAWKGYFRQKRQAETLFDEDKE